MFHTQNSFSVDEQDCYLMESQNDISGTNPYSSFGTSNPEVCATICLQDARCMYMSLSGTLCSLYSENMVKTNVPGARLFKKKCDGIVKFLCCWSFWLL